MKAFEAVYDTVLPPVEERWERGGAILRDGRPFFPKLEVAGKPIKISERPLRHRLRKVGSSMLLSYTMSDGIDRLVRHNRLDDTYRSDIELTATAGSAWTTTPHRGYAARRDNRTALEHGIDTVTIGAEGSTHAITLSAEQLDGISLAKSAQSEMMIHADVIARYGVSNRQYARSDSRDGMIEPGRWMYAEDYGIEKVFSDIRAPCAPDRIEAGDVPTVGVWLGVEAFGGAAVTAALIAEGNVGVLRGTFDLHPRALKASFEGIMPALMTGEAGRLAEMTHDDMAAHIVLYGRDILSPDERWREIYAPKHNVTLRSAPRGSHANLLTRTGLQHNRLGRAVLSLQNDAELDIDYVINGHRDGYQKQAGLRLVV